MARFTKSNRHANETMKKTADRKRRTPTTDRSYFQSIGFDFAMI